MKPFNLEEAKQGKPVCNREGNDVRIICFDKRSKYNTPIVALHGDFDGQEEVRVHRNDGSWASKESKHDLFMKGEKREGWVNIYKNTKYKDLCVPKIYPTKEEAYLNRITIGYITTTKIEWEE